MLTTLDEKRRRAVLRAMEVIQRALGGQSGRPMAEPAASEANAVESPVVSGAPSKACVALRPHTLGDIGWVVQRHGELHHREYGWTEEFEALVAEITVEFLRKLDPARDRCWIAECDGQRVGCFAKDATTAKLRLLLVDPQARGLGLGALS